MEKINRMAENFGIDEVMWNAVSEHLEKIRGIPPEGWGESGGLDADPADSSDVMGEASASEATDWGG